MIELVNEAIQYLCVAWLIIFGIPTYSSFVASLFHAKKYKFDYTDCINGVALFYLLAAGLPSLKLLGN